MGIPNEEGISLTAAAGVAEDRHVVAQFILGQMGTEDDRLKTELGSESRQLNRLGGDFGIEGGKDTSTDGSNVFISHVLMARHVLMKKYDIPEEEALEKAYRMQLDGILVDKGFQEERPMGTSWWRIESLRGTDPSGSAWDNELRRTHGHEYVSPDALHMPILPETAHIAAENYTEKEWMQNKGIMTSEGRRVDMIPAEGKVRVMARSPEEDFVVTFKAVPNLPLGQTVQIFNTLNAERVARGEEQKELEYKWQSSFDYLQSPAP
jgi:hypothetical protein